ncbi:Homeodomain-like protein [Microdochium trichocladiopsis]|uniref:Homeodomain-like protein n=1 Tax=Microdochium trichocladiopsis TaxID=1682393 RepID=A0A9P9BRK5_9PEZI|nr:Homeodomain-like protein [Microdochium trichocladiopsis]KAH7032833.1 Homeodomain-like protein [Microdochium trichocladiopsis]
MSSQRRGPWSQKEDHLLMHLVSMSGPLNWVRISQELTSRTPKQCRERYHQNLKPTLNHEPITPEEGVMIERLVEQMGKRWAEIARKLHNRSDNAVKNWWNGSMNRRKRMVGRRRNSSYEDHHDGMGYTRAAPPPSLRLATFSQQPQYHQQPHYPQHHHHHHIHTEPAYSGHYMPSAWSRHHGMPSPSAVSPGGESVDGVPSLVSDAGSVYATSPKSTVISETPIELPPLRIGESASPVTPSFSCSPKLHSFASGHDQLRLPPIKPQADSRSQLPTAPNSPVFLQRTPQSEEWVAPRDSRMKMSSLLS